MHDSEFFSTEELSKKYFLEEDGKIREASNDEEWQSQERILARDCHDGVCIVTAFLVFDHRVAVGTCPIDGLWNEMPSQPVLFGTMIFGGRHGGTEYMYTTKGRAMVGHEELVALVRERP